MKSVSEIIEIAQKHAVETVNGSAIVCVNDARKLNENGEWRFARYRALRSLEHSIGIFHKDYIDCISD